MALRTGPALRRAAAAVLLAGELRAQCRHEIVVVELGTRATTEHAGQEHGRRRTAKRWTGP